MSGRPNSQKHQNEGRVERHQRMNPFGQMDRMMMGFGGFGQDSFFGDMMGFGKDPFEDMFSFSDMHKNIHSKGNQGSYVCQSFVSSSKMGPDGKMVTENYYENSMGQNKGGKTISQKQQAYKNNQGVNRIAEERMLDNKGRKIVREKKGSNIEETNHYFNIDEDDAQEFDSEWKQVDDRFGFAQNHQKYLQGSQKPRQMQIGYEPREDPRARESKNQGQVQRSSVKKRQELDHEPIRNETANRKVSKNSDQVTTKSKKY